MNRRAALAIVLTLLAANAQADFESLVRAVASHRGLHRVSIPGLSLVRLAVRMVHPDGVHDFQLAVFEGDAQFDSRDFETILRGSSSAPMVQVHSNRTGEVTVVWARPAGNDLFEILLLAHEPKGDTVVVRAVANGEQLARQVSDPRHASRIAQR